MTRLDGRGVIILLLKGNTEMQGDSFDVCACLYTRSIGQEPSLEFLPILEAKTDELDFFLLWAGLVVVDIARLSILATIFEGLSQL